MVRLTLKQYLLCTSGTQCEGHSPVLVLDEQYYDGDRDNQHKSCKYPE